ncbi:MAG: hypothetical protein LBT00_08375 [Spirochaetaceae bacterium]|nr:hypothetical protein [Spirochaetaceae bacterium]
MLAVIAASVLVLLPATRTALVAFGGTLLRRPLNVEHWQQTPASMAFAGLFVSGALLFIGMHGCNTPGLSRKYHIWPPCLLSMLVYLIFF